MADHSLQRELDPIAPRRPDLRHVPRSGALLADLALDLQRQAGNRSVAELIRRDRSPVGDSAVGSTLAAVAGSHRPRELLPTPRPAAAAPSVQREPCVDCPDTPVATMADPDTLSDPTAAG
jgi:hypothetical protein